MHSTSCNKIFCWFLFLEKGKIIFFYVGKFGMLHASSSSFTGVAQETPASALAAALVVVVATVGAGGPFRPPRSHEMLRIFCGLNAA
jgi:hypothetical protein